MAAVATTAAGPIARLQGLPPQANHELAPEYGDLAWSVNGDLFVKLAQFVLDSPVGTLPADRRAHRRTTRLFRCPGGRACVPLPLSARATTELQPVFSANTARRAFSVAPAGDGALAVSVDGDGHTAPAVPIGPPDGPAITLPAARRLPHLEQLSHSGRAQALCLPCMWPVPNIESHPRCEESVFAPGRRYDPPHARVGGYQPQGVTAACRPAPPGGAGIQGAAPRRGRWAWGTG